LGDTNCRGGFYISHETHLSEAEYRITREGYVPGTEILILPGTRLMPWEDGLITITINYAEKHFKLALMHACIADTEKLLIILYQYRPIILRIIVLSSLVDKGKRIVIIEPTFFALIYEFHKLINRKPTMLVVMLKH